MEFQVISDAMARLPDIKFSKVISDPDSQAWTEGQWPDLETNSLLRQMRLIEKVELLSGSSFVSAGGNRRLHIPTLKVVDGVNGVKGSTHFHGQTTACFPSTTCLGATWNPNLLYDMGIALAREAKHKAAQVILGPSVNMQRDPRGGRNFECFSEDPLLTGTLAASIVNGIQAEGVAACPKHFVANDSETQRRRYNVTNSPDERVMREIYMAAFQVLFRNSNPWAIMTAYNQVNGIFCSESPMIDGVLRNEWRYQGCVMSDWYGTRSGASAINAGLDLEMPGPSVFRGAKLVHDVETGAVDERVVDKRVTNILRLIRHTQLSHSSKPEESHIDVETSKLARRVASEGIVLLQNRKGVLPLDASTAPQIAVIGAPSIHPTIGGGGSASVIPQYVQRPLDCIRELSTRPELVVGSYGVKVHDTIPGLPLDQVFARNGANGIDVRYFNDGVERPILEEFLESSNVAMVGFSKPGLNKDFHYEISTAIIPKTTGLHSFGIQSTGSFKLIINDQEILAKTMSGITIEDFLFEPRRLERTCRLQMRAGQPYQLRLVVQPHQRQDQNEPPAHAAKVCFMESYSDDDSIAEAVAVASKSDVSIIFAGRNSERESEGFDLPDIRLPPKQVKMIKAVAAASRRSVLILHCGNPIDVRDFVDDVDAVVNAHFFGQEGGAALADIIYGEVCPSGKLAVTWPRSLEDSPSYPHFPAAMGDRGYEITYAEGLKLGYRHDWSLRSPQWVFGHGLSYTTFQYSSLLVLLHGSRNEDKIDSEFVVSVTVKNTGSMAAYEVVQVYVEDLVSSIWRPFRELKGFTKVWIEPQESQEVQIKLDEKHALSFWDEKELQWKAEKGEFKIHVNELKASLFLEEDLLWQGL